MFIKVLIALMIGITIRRLVNVIKRERSYLKESKWIHLISVGGLLVSITVLFQAAPVFLPFIGIGLSPLSTLPIAIAATINLLLGIMVFITSVLLLLFISTQEAMILLFTTGLLGSVLGALIYRKGRLVTILTSTIVLFIGMLLLTYVTVIPAFHDFTATISLAVVLIFYSVFASIYVTVWVIMFRKFSKYVTKYFHAYR